jgi:hypothetical protein
MKRVLLFSPFLFLITVLLCGPGEDYGLKMLSPYPYGLKMLSPYTIRHFSRYDY